MCQDIVTYEDVPENELPMTRCVMPIVSERGDEAAIHGTAVMVGQGVAITAAHVIDAALGSLPAGEDGAEISDVRVSLVESDNSLGSPFIWCVSTGCHHPELDLAILGIIPHPRLDPAQSTALRPNVIKLEPPEVGEACVIYGFPGSRANVSYDNGRRRMDTWVTPKKSSGVVTTVHPYGVDNFLLKYPCFETNARADGGMSGGGVFINNMLIGLVSSGMRATEESNQETSFHSLLSPFFDIPQFVHPTLGQVSFEEAISAS